MDNEQEKSKEKNETLITDSKKPIAQEKETKPEPKKKIEKMVSGIDPKFASKFNEKSKELKEKIRKEQLEEKIRLHTKSPLKSILPAIIGLIVVVLFMVTFTQSAKIQQPEIDRTKAPKISADGEKALSPENSTLPTGLKGVEESFYTNTPNDPFLEGAFQAVLEQKKAVEKYKLPLEIEDSSGIKFRLIPPGRFMMGSPTDEKFREDDEFQHIQEFLIPFYVSKNEITTDQYQKIMGTLPYNSKKDPGLPVSGVSLNDALIFVQQLNNRLPDNADYKYFIISESEWEYACRAGTKGAYFYGHYTLSDEYAIYRSSTTTASFEQVGKKRPNAWGLYDMIGNAIEWTRTPFFIYACGPTQYAGSDYLTATRANRTIEEASWDTPIYDGEHPENLINMFDKFDVPMRAFGINADIRYWDLNNNKVYDNHEPIWRDSLFSGKIGEFDPDIDLVILSFARTIPPGTKGEKETLYYYDKNLNTQWDAGECLWVRNDKARNESLFYVFRGGSYIYTDENLRSAARFSQQRQNAPTDAGIRLVLYLNKIKP